MTQFNRLQTIKRRFFAMRNGVLADTLRRAGAPFRIIFGLNLPQIAEIAAETGHDAALGRELWANSSTRESMLLAPMLLSPADVTAREALDMMAWAPSAEVCDVLCHRLLRHMPGAMETARRAALSDEPMSRYGAVRLALNVVRQAPGEARALALAALERDGEWGPTLRVARQLIDEADFLENGL